MKARVISFPKISEQDFHKVLRMLDVLEIKYRDDSNDDCAEKLLDCYRAHTMHVLEERGEVKVWVTNYAEEEVFSAGNEVEGWNVTFRGETVFVAKTELSDTDTELDVIRHAFPDITRDQIDDEDENVSGPELEEAKGQGAFWLIEDGFIKDLGDTYGMAAYLRSVGIFSEDAYISTVI